MSETKAVDYDLASLRGKLNFVNDVLETKKAQLSEQYKKLEIFCNELYVDLNTNGEIKTAYLSLITDADSYEYIHSVKAAVYAFEIGKRCGFSETTLKQLLLGALVHDLGNVFVDKRILSKTGPLNTDEWQQVKEHPGRGAGILRTLGAPVEVCEVVGQHHERMDGAGYPEKLKGPEINLNARIVSLVDVFVALTSERPGAIPLDSLSAIGKMKNMKGKFDAELLRVFEELLPLIEPL